MEGSFGSEIPVVFESAMYHWLSEYVIRMKCWHFGQWSLAKVTRMGDTFSHILISFCQILLFLPYAFLLKKMKLKMFVKDIPCRFLLYISVFSSEEGLEVIQCQFWDSSAFTSFCCNPILGADGQWASPCCFRVVGYFEPTSLLPWGVFILGSLG